MARFYFRVDDVFFYLDATTDVNTVYPAELSSSPMQDGSDQSDNYIIRQPMCTMSGKISDIKTASSVETKTTRQWIDGVLSKAMDSESPVFLKNYIDAEASANWFITSFNVKQNNKKYCVGYQGDNGDVKQAFKVSIQFKQAILGRGIQTTVEPSAAYTDAAQAKGRKNAATQQFGDGAKDQESYQDTLDKIKTSVGVIERNNKEILSTL